MPRNWLPQAAASSPASGTRRVSRQMITPRSACSGSGSATCKTGMPGASSERPPLAFQRAFSWLMCGKVRCVMNRPVSASANIQRRSPATPSPSSCRLGRDSPMADLRGKRYSAERCMARRPEVSETAVIRKPPPALKPTERYFSSSARRWRITSTSLSGWNLDRKLSQPTFLTMASLKLPDNEVCSTTYKSRRRGS